MTITYQSVLSLVAATESQHSSGNDRSRPSKQMQNKLVCNQLIPITSLIFLSGKDDGEMKQKGIYQIYGLQKSEKKIRQYS